MMTFDVKEAVRAQAVPQGGGAWPTWRRLTDSERIRIRGLLCYLVGGTLVFIQPLARLMVRAAHSPLQSYILLVPFISGYLLYVQRRRLLIAYHSSVLGAFVLGGVGIAAVTAAIVWPGSFGPKDELPLLVIGYVSALYAGGFLFLGSKWMSAAAFPLAFLIFVVPLPDALIGWLEDASANASADVAAVYFNVLGTPLVRHGRVFELPGIVLQVAQECSGIHSSLVLFITSLVASHLLLRTWWGRIAVAAFVIPLGIIRNGFRILVIGLLCVHIGPRMINSNIHRHGGPLFFALSLAPLVLLVLWLRRRERRTATTEEL